MTTARTRPLDVEVTVGSLAPGGDGVAHVDLEGRRRAVFVPRSAPGDRMRIQVDASRTPARGRILEIEAPGGDRVRPVCSSADRCGGCDWMHLSLDAQSRAHVDHVRAALPSPWRGAEIRCTAAREGAGVRSRARVHVHCDRRGRATVGMYGARTHDPVEVDECVILEAPIEAARRLLSELLSGAPGQGDVDVAKGAGGRPVLYVRWSGTLAPSTFARVQEAVDRGDLAGVQIATAGATRPIRIGDPTPWMTGADGLPLRLAPGGFGQANERANGDLACHVAGVAAARAKAGEHAVELYAGAGNLSVLLAHTPAALACVESDRAACDAARANLAARALSARVVEADATEYVWSDATRLIVMDPPRAGARAVAQRLVTSRVARVVYVSCDAQTLGRDLAIMEKAYSLSSIATFEMFPQTSHVEIVTALERRRT